MGASVITLKFSAQVYSKRAFASLAPLSADILDIEWSAIIQRRRYNALQVAIIPIQISLSFSNNVDKPCYPISIDAAFVVDYFSEI